MINMARTGINWFIEFGPGKTLTGFVKKTLPQATAMNVEDLASLDALQAAVSRARADRVPAASALAPAGVATAAVTAGAGAGGGVW
jgi:acyl transferase domain-containing protein